MFWFDKVLFKIFTSLKLVHLKEKINTAWQRILIQFLQNKNLIRNLAILGTSFIIFYHPIINLINKLIVNPFLKDVTDNRFSVLLILIFFDLICCLIIRRKIINRHIPSFNLFSYLLFASITYAVIRWCAIWDFHGYEIENTKIVYLDLFIALPILYFIFFIQHLFRKEKEIIKDGIFLSEDSPSLSKDDLLGRKIYAKKIADELVKVKSSKAFAIGITGIWGSGKSFFLELIKKELSEDTITIDFNPWKSGSPSSIINDFFQNLSDSLSEYSEELSSELKTYVKDIIPIKEDSSGIIEAISKILKLGSSDVGYENIDNAIQNLDKLVVIFIDDLDRLDKKEIIEVIRIIRNTANFGNIVFVVAYDKNYILNAIKEINSHNSEFFLEKIFQLEVPLPVFESNKLNNLFLNIIRKSLNNEDEYKRIKEKINNDRNSISIAKYLSTIRDVIRFSNLFTLDYHFVKGNVDISDFFYVQLLKLKYPSIYNLIYQGKKNFFLEKNNKNTSTEYLYIKTNEYLNKVCSMIEKEHLQYNIPISNIGEVISILSSLFEVRPYDINFRKDNLYSIKHKSSFHKYFTPILFEKDLSNNEFEEFFKKDFTTLKKKIDEWEKESKLYSFIERLESLEINGTLLVKREDFEKLLKVYFSKLINTGYTYHELQNRMYDKENEITNRFYNGSKDLYHAFVKFLLKEYKTEYFCYNLVSNNIDYFILSIDELKLILLEKFKTHIESITDFPLKNWSPTWNMFHYNSFNVDGKKVFNKDAIEVFKNFITKQFIRFLEIIVNDNPFFSRDTKSKDYKTISSIVLEIFGTYEDFEIFINTQPSHHENEKYKEFIIFWNTFKRNKFKPVPFEFKFLFKEI